MGRLFWKIFLWFWLAMILMIVGVTWGTARFLSTTENGHIMDPLTKVASFQVTAVAAVLEYGGESAARSLLEEIAATSPFEILIIDDQGQDIRGRSVQEAALSTPRSSTAQSVDSLEGNRFRVQVNSPIATRRFGGPFKRDPRQVLSRLALLGLVSSLFCLWLAWYLAKPIRRLREATRHLSEGDLEVRVTETIGKRRDEIADLGRDFDYMAGRLQALLLSQRQLLSDVSHELRSPLARLQVALGLARKKANESAERELDRIEREADHLDDLIGEILALAQLQAREIESLEDHIDIAQLIQSIVDDAEYEAASRNRHVHFTGDITPMLRADGELLLRALENVVRNAVRYTAKSTTVKVLLQAAEERDGWITITVCDFGPGVPEEQLSTMFEPFVRTTAARDRGRGGHGLGLAIAKRAISLHGGVVSATNRKDGGLCVGIELPLSAL
ncbi:MAG: ATP-binding protein [Pseudomonadota bacterium]